jgi:hypothetical protein
LIAWCTAIVAFVAALEAIRRVSKWAKQATIAGISAAVDLSDTGHLVAYHLGPNGDTKALHERVKSLEGDATERKRIESDHHSQNTARLDSFEKRLPPKENR